MRKISVVLALLALVACGKKDKDAPAGGGSAGSAVMAEKPITCPPGNAIQDGACVVVVTPEKVAVVAQQQSRIDELAKMLEKVETVAAPIELMNALRQLDQWKTFVAKNERLQMFDGVIASLDQAVKVLREFKGSLGETSARLENLRGELDRLLKDTGASKRIEEVRAQISAQLRTAVEPFAKDVAQTIRGALAPLELRFNDAANLVTLGCAALALGRAGDKAKELCDQATTAFGSAKKYVEDFKAKPAALFDEVTAKLESELSTLIDEQTKLAVDAAQTVVSDALKLPGGAGSAGGSAAAPGAGSAAAPAAGSAAAPAATP